MTEKQLAAKIAEAVRRHGPTNAVAHVLSSLNDSDIISLWQFVGPRVVREVWRTHRPQLELVPSVQGVLRQLIAISSTGEKKELGQVRAPELFLIAQFRGRMGETLTKQASVLRRVGNSIGDRTVGEAWDDLNESSRKALLDAFGITAPKNVALCALSSLKTIR